MFISSFSSGFSAAAGRLSAPLPAHNDSLSDGRNGNDCRGHKTLKRRQFDRTQSALPPTLESAASERAVKKKVSKIREKKAFLVQFYCCWVAHIDCAGPSVCVRRALSLSLTLLSGSPVSNGTRATRRRTCCSERISTKTI